jgi:HAD superfamily hydrolase (TIGR01450 family)
VAWVIDLDGVVWLGERRLPGAAEAIGRLRAAGERVLFVTNNSSASLAAQEAKLARFGIPAHGDVITSAMAGARLVEPGERAFVCGGPGVDEALLARGAEPVRSDGSGGDIGDVDVVVVGLDRDFDYERLRLAVRAVQRGARFVATNDDATFPTPDGPVPGGGALVAAVAYATGVEATVAGKPHRPMADVVHALVGQDQANGATDGTVVGDRPERDGAFAATLGYRFALVLTGVTSAEDLPVTPTPDVVADSLDALVPG